MPESRQFRFSSPAAASQFGQMLRLPLVKLGPIEEGGSFRCIGDVVGKSATEVGKSTGLLKLLCNEHTSDRSEMFGELGFDHIQHARIGGI